LKEAVEAAQVQGVGATVAEGFEVIRLDDNARASFRVRLILLGKHFF